MPYQWPYFARDLQDILAVLGTTKNHFWLFVNSGASGDVPCIGTSATTYSLSDENGAVTALAEAGPLQLPWGGYAYHFDSSGNMHIAAAAAQTGHSFGNGTADSAFSLGMWIMPEVKNDNTLMALYNAAANEEWKWGLAATTGALYLELYDASANASEIGTADGFQRNTTQGATALVDGSPDLHQWNFVVTTYDGTQTAPKITHYINNHDVSNANRDSVESGSYVAMEDVGTNDFLIGASELTTAPAEEYDGYMAFPFLTGKELTAAEVSQLYDITAPMVLGR